MSESYPINSKTKKAIDGYLAAPGQSLGLIGQKWLNKSAVAKELAESLLELEAGSLNKYPYFLHIGNHDFASITLEEVTINDFIQLKVPLKKQISRAVIIDRADRLTLEAQNALLKNLEEPPAGTVFILTASSLSELLPTIISRLNIINVYKPSKEKLINYYQSQGYLKEDIEQAFLIADGLPGLIDQLLTNQESPLQKALDQARKLLSSTTLERLSIVNELSKNKGELNNIFFVIKQMAKIGLNSNNAKSAARWKRVLSATLNSEERLRANVQVKLLLTDYILSIS